jgi:hypothetical protein
MSSRRDHRGQLPAPTPPLSAFASTCSIRASSPGLSIPACSPCRPLRDRDERTGRIAEHHSAEVEGVSTECLTSGMTVTIYGVCAVTFIMVMYALESRGRLFVLGVRRRVRGSAFMGRRRS